MCNCVVSFLVKNGANMAPMRIVAWALANIFAGGAEICCALVTYLFDYCHAMYVLYYYYPDNFKSDGNGY